MQLKAAQESETSAIDDLRSVDSSPDRFPDKVLFEGTAGTQTDFKDVIDEKEKEQEQDPSELSQGGNSTIEENYR